jgi:NitT/TauT family transport system substrate-binding protein
VGTGGISASLFNALARGVDMKIVADFSRMTPGHGFGAFLVRKDFEMPSIASLRGQRVGFNNPGAPCHYMVGRMLESGGLTVNDVEVVNMPFNTIPGALAKREVDGVCAAEPWVTNTLRTGDGRLVMTYDDLLPNMQVSVIMISNQMAADRPFVERFLAAFLRAVPESREKSPEVLESVARATGLDVATLRETIWTDLDGDGRVNVDSIKDQQDFFLRAGLVQTPVDIDRYVDLTYLPRR